GSPQSPRAGTQRRAVGRTRGCGRFGFGRRIDDASHACGTPGAGSPVDTAPIATDTPVALAGAFRVDSHAPGLAPLGTSSAPDGSTADPVPGSRHTGLLDP